MAYTYLFSGDLKSAETVAGQMLELCRTTGFRGGLSLELVVLGAAKLLRGDLEQGWKLGHQALEIARQVDRPIDLINVLYLLGQLSLAENEPAQALSYFEQVQTACHPIYPGRGLDAMSYRGMAK